MIIAGCAIQRAAQKEGHVINLWLSHGMVIAERLDEENIRGGSRVAKSWNAYMPF